MDIKKAKLDPASVFKMPQEVLEQDQLSKEDKIFILKQWEYDELELSVAEEENMTGNERHALLRQIHLCLEKIEP